MADDAGITFDYDVSIPHTLSITAVDLYVLLGNTLDNAIEACESLPEEQRYIHLQFRTFHEILFLQIKNPYSKTIRCAFEVKIMDMAFKMFVNALRSTMAIFPLSKKMGYLPCR